MAKLRHFLSLRDLSAEELQAVLARAIELKKAHKQGAEHTPLKYKTLAMVFEKSSTRTRVSFEVAMTQLGGKALFLSPRDTQLGRGEPVEDTARVLSSMVDVICVRTFAQEKLELFAEHACVPVINALTDSFHPCQLLADMMTYIEQKGTISGAKVAWIGDGNNMCRSYINAAKLLGFELAIATPPGFEPSGDYNALKSMGVTVHNSPQDAAKNADLISTDVWASMGQEDEQASRIKAFLPYQVNQSLLDVAKPDALFMHCLPAHRDEEVTAAVLEGPNSVVWVQAENRLHAQKALLEFLM